MELRENNIIHINLSDIQEMVSESVKRIVSENNIDETLPRGYWTRERCYDEAKKYDSKQEFRKLSPSAYSASWKNGWLADYTWFETLWEKKWNRETCYEEAKKYKSRADFYRGNNSAYTAALNHGWLDDYTWFSKAVRDMPEYVVYCYKDEETNSIYIGLTNNMKRRHKQHCKGILRRGQIVYDVVYKYFNSINKNIPDPIILEKNLFADDAQMKENFYVEYFKNEGYNVINLAKTGSLGGYTKWTRESCYNEARKYNSMGEFKKGNASAYNAAKAKGWIDDYYWFPIPKKHWDYESCYNEAEKYNSRTEFQNGSKGAYKSAWTNGWLDDFDWLSRK